jgi:hypothetical protein
MDGFIKTDRRHLDGHHVMIDHVGHEADLEARRRPLRRSRDLGRRCSRRSPPGIILRDAPGVRDNECENQAAYNPHELLLCIVDEQLTDQRTLASDA